MCYKSWSLNQFNFIDIIGISADIANSQSLI